MLAKSASGALELVPLVTVQNLARGLEELREHGFLLVGLDSTGDADLGAVATCAACTCARRRRQGPASAHRATCDRVARIDVPGEIKNLNVSNAAALALYVASNRRELASARRSAGSPLGRAALMVTRCGSEIAPPDVEVRDGDGDQHHRKGVEREGHEAERHAVALAKSGHGRGWPRRRPTFHCRRGMRQATGTTRAA